jgi:hypothetical protein
MAPVIEMFLKSMPKGLKYTKEVITRKIERLEATWLLGLKQSEGSPMLLYCGNSFFYSGLPAHK